VDTSDGGSVRGRRAADDGSGRLLVINGSVAFCVSQMSKTFPGQVALVDVDIEIHEGEIHALVGQNGSGKSTLVKILAGYHRPDPGATVSVRGQAFALGSAASARAAGIRFVHQDLGLIEALSVAENFHLTLDTGRAFSRVARKSERQVARQALANLGYDISPEVIVGQLADSERTAVAVARALHDLPARTGMLVLDEATASLPGPEVERLFMALRRVAASGVAILFISHYLDEVLRLADRVTVLRDGRRIATTAVGELSHDRLVELLLGRQLLADLGTELGSAAAVADPVLVVRGVNGTIVVDLDLDIHPGEIVGVAGLTGSGREEVAGLLAGRLPRHGSVRVDGCEVRPLDPTSAVRLGMCLVPADRKAHALMPTADVRENTTLVDVSAFWSKGVLRRQPEVAEVRRWITELDIRPNQPDAVVATLSGGNQQKVVMARWLRIEPRVLVLDEPTQGVDVGSKADIHRLVDRAAADGAAVVVCSTDSAELARLASRVLVLQRGRVAGELKGSDITVERIEQLQLTIAADQPNEQKRRDRTT
jgi:ribose transport system ATP-binding protein